MVRDAGPLVSRRGGGGRVGHLRFFLICVIVFAGEKFVGLLQSGGLIDERLAGFGPVAEQLLLCLLPQHA